MSEDTFKKSAEISSEALEKNSENDLLGCCLDTIKAHARYNPMMVCNDCHQIIKCFEDEKAFRNFLKFCDTKRRPVAIGKADTYFIVVFDSSNR
jgi:hypothetical protein